jgi:hypothetical protein
VDLSIEADEAQTLKRGRRFQLNSVTPVELSADSVQVSASGRLGYRGSENFEARLIVNKSHKGVALDRHMSECVAVWCLGSCPINGSAEGGIRVIASRDTQKIVGAVFTGYPPCRWRIADLGVPR